MNSTLPIFVNNYGHPILEGVANEISWNLQVDQTVVIGALLASSALPVQAAYDFEGRDGRTIPCSLMVGVEAGPTRGKNSIMDKVSSPIREFESEVRQASLGEQAGYQVETIVWKKAKLSLERKIGRASETGEDISQLKKDLGDLITKKPVPPQQLTLVTEDATYKGLAGLFHPGYRSLGIMSSEGGTVIKSDAFRRPEVTSQLWSGQAVAIDTVRDQIRFEDARASWLLMAQPEIWKRLVEQDGNSFKATGASARMLMFRDIALAGCQPLHDTALTWGHHQRYANRIKELLHEGWGRSQEKSFARHRIRMTQDAHRLWVQFRNWAKEQSQPGGYYERAQDHAARLGENVARIATVIHVLEGFGGDIRESTVRFAIDLVAHCSCHYMALFVPPPQLEADAAFLETKFFGICQAILKSEGVTWASARTLRGNCPSRLRGPNGTRERYDCALQFLLAQNLVRSGYKGGVEYLDLSNCRNLAVTR